MRTGWPSISKAFEPPTIARSSYGIAAELGPEDTRRLRWKWADVPTRWRARWRRPRRERSPQRSRWAWTRPGRPGRCDGGSAADRAGAPRLPAGRDDRAAAGARRSLVADRALEIGRAAGPAGAPTSAARDARTVLLHALNRYDEALENDEAPASRCSVSIRWREEQMDVCASAARTRRRAGDFAGSVAAARPGEQLAHRDDPLAVAARAEHGRDLFLMGPLGRRARLYERFLASSAAPSRRAPRPPVAAGGRSGAVAGDPHRCGASRGGRPDRAADAGIEPALRPRLAHALLGAGEPALALDRSRA